MKLCIAGKNNIAVKATKFALNYVDKKDLYIIINENEDGKDSFQMSFLKFAKNHNLNIIDLTEAYKISNLIFLSLEFDKIVKPNLFKTDKIFNVHFSPLPKYKGMYTSYWPLINGESESGVTLHRIDYGIDTGDIIAQKTFELNERMTAKQLYLKYIETGIEIVNDNLKNLLNNNYFVRSQGYQNSTYYSKTSIDYKNISVLLKQTAFNIKNQIRALNFRDYQLPSINQHHVTHAIITGERSNVPAGDLIYEDEIKFKYSTIDYDIIIFKDHHDDILDVCRKGEMEILEEFYEFRYDLDDQNLLGWTPLIVACYNGQVEVVKYLLDKGVDVNKTNYNGTTPLMFAKDYCILNNDYEIIKILFRCGADASRKDYCGKDIFDYILEEYEVKIFEKIKELELMK